MAPGSCSTSSTHPIHHPSQFNPSIDFAPKVRPTPTPRHPSHIPRQALTSASALDRGSLPPRLRTLPRLDSYNLSSASLATGTRNVSTSSEGSAGQGSSADHHSEEDQPLHPAAEEEEEGESEELDTSEDDQDDGDLSADRTITATDNTTSSFQPGQPPDSFPPATRRHDWVTFAAVSPSTPNLFTRSMGPSSALSPHRLPSSQLASPSSYFDPRPKPTLALSMPAQTPGDRARMILMSPSVPSMVQNPVSQHDSRRPSLIARRSQSVLDFHSLALPLAPTTTIISPVPQSSTLPIPSANTLPTVLASPPDSPSHPLDNASLVDSPVNLNAPSLVSSLVPPNSSPSLRVARRQSMYEMRPSTNDPPPYQQIYQGSGGVKQIVLPREEEGREGLPKYTCVIHLEGWMPRKMEFRSPGIQAKDRAWKRQYVVLHGTMIRIYKCDPHLHSVPGEHDLHLDARDSTTSDLPTSYPPPLHFHMGRYDSAPSSSLKEAALARASQLPTQHNSLIRVYTLQNAESGLAADYLKRKNVVRVRAEGEQFLLQAKDDRGVIDLIEALQAATNVSLDLDVRALPKFITLPRRRRRRRQTARGADPSSGGQGRVTLGAEVADAMVAEAESVRRPVSGSPLRPRPHSHSRLTPSTQDRMADMLAEEQVSFTPLPHLDQRVADVLSIAFGSFAGSLHEIRPLILTKHESISLPDASPLHASASAIT